VINKTAAWYSWH